MRLRSLVVAALAALLLAGALFADFLSPESPSRQDLENFFAPPTRIHFVDARGSFHLRPFVYRYELVDPLNVVYQEKTDARYPLRFFGPGWGYRLWGLLPSSRHLAQAPEGVPFHPLGTDELGRDVLARTLAGARTSLLVVALGGLAYGALGLGIGAAAGLAGGWLDAGLMRVSEFVMALPALYLILALRAILPLHIPYWQTMLLTVGTVAAVTWPPMARGVRGLILQLRNAGYVEAARGLGATRWQILRRHMLPALAPFAAAQMALAAPVFIVGEMLLSFLGVGFEDADTSWGTMLQKVKDLRVVTDFWWNLAPLPLIVAALLALNLAPGRSAERELPRVTL